MWVNWWGNSWVYQELYALSLTLKRKMTGYIFLSRSTTNTGMNDMTDINDRKIVERSRERHISQLNPLFKDQPCTAIPERGLAVCMWLQKNVAIKCFGFSHLFKMKSRTGRCRDYLRTAARNFFLNTLEFYPNQHARETF